jgi:hypothetical protein
VSKDLDESFGRVGRRSNVTVRALERKFRPVSLFVLENGCESTVSQLVQLGKLSAIRILAESVRLIWSVNRSGVIYVAFEELVDPNKGPTGKVFTPSMEILVGQDKLGHPALLNDNEARISGELYLEDGAWVINNKSGRFGFLDDRCEAHLSNVSEIFRRYGLVVEIDFLPPT